PGAPTCHAGRPIYYPSLKAQTPDRWCEAVWPSRDSEVAVVADLPPSEEDVFEPRARGDFSRPPAAQGPLNHTVGAAALPLLRTANRFCGGVRIITLSSVQLRRCALVTARSAKRIVLFLPACHSAFRRAAVIACNPYRPPPRIFHGNFSNLWAARRVLPHVSGLLRGNRRESV